MFLSFFICVVDTCFNSFCLSTWSQRAGIRAWSSLTGWSSLPSDPPSPCVNSKRQGLEIKSTESFSSCPHKQPSRGVWRVLGNAGPSRVRGKVNFFFKSLKPGSAFHPSITRLQLTSESKLSRLVRMPLPDPPTYELPWASENVLEHSAFPLTLSRKSRCTDRHQATSI